MPASRGRSTSRSSRAADVVEHRHGSCARVSVRGGGRLDRTYSSQRVWHETRPAKSAERLLPLAEVRANRPDAVLTRGSPGRGAAYRRGRCYDGGIDRVEAFASDSVGAGPALVPKPASTLELPSGTAPARQRIDGLSATFSSRGLQPVDRLRKKRYGHVDSSRARRRNDRACIGGARAPRAPVVGSTARPPASTA